MAGGWLTNLRKVGCVQRQRTSPWATMPDHPILDRGRQRLPEPMTEEELEDFLTEAIGLYAEQTKTPVSRVQTFAEAKSPSVSCCFSIASSFPASAGFLRR